MLVTMSDKEIHRLPVIQAVCEKRLRRRDAASQLGISERQVWNRESALHALGALTWNDSGNQKRYGQRDKETGAIKYAFGVDLSPLAALLPDEEQKGVNQFLAMMEGSSNPGGVLRDPEKIKNMRPRELGNLAGRWVTERRNVLEDYRLAFAELGDAGGKLRGLAIASDTDNTGETAHAGFADFRFVAETSGCLE